MSADRFHSVRPAFRLISLRLWLFALLCALTLGACSDAGPLAPTTQAPVQISTASLDSGQALRPPTGPLYSYCSPTYPFYCVIEPENPPDPCASIGLCDGDPGTGCQESVGVGQPGTVTIQGCEGDGGGGGGSTDPTDPGDPGTGGGECPMSLGGGCETGDDCDARIPDCPIPLNQTQIAGIRTALSMVRQDIHDPEVQEICNHLQAKALALLEAGKIKAGKLGVTEDLDNPDVIDGHSGQVSPDLTGIHIDTDYLISSISFERYKPLGAIVLHEAAHVNGEYNHPPDEVTVPGQYYTTHPFDYTQYTGHQRPGVEECM